jgi:antitoxin component of RelBE/YafQ-DinJ toxin-antitoxin module
MKEDETGKPIMSESDIENKVASKLVHMLLSKGVSKIIKKYGYLPVDYLKNEKNEKTLEKMAESYQPSKKKRATSGNRLA